jgi:hypothetical protein
VDHNARRPVAQGGEERSFGPVRYTTLPESSCGCCSHLEIRIALQDAYEDPLDMARRNVEMTKAILDDIAPQNAWMMEVSAEKPSHATGSASIGEQIDKETQPLLVAENGDEFDAHIALTERDLVPAF